MFSVAGRAKVHIVNAVAGELIGDRGGLTAGSEVPEADQFGSGLCDLPLVWFLA